MAKFAPADDQFAKLTSADRNGFAVGDFSQNLIFGTVGGFLLFYLTSISGISAAVGATIFLVVRWINVFWDPWVGSMVDRSPVTKDGKYRKYIKTFGIPLVILASLLFLPVGTWLGTNMTMKITWAFVSYLATALVYSWVNIPYGSLMAGLTRDNDEIAKLTTTRMTWANTGNLLVYTLFPLFVQLATSYQNKPTAFGLGNLKLPLGNYASPHAAGAWFGVFAVYMVLGAVGLYITYRTSHERVLPEGDAPQVKFADLWNEFSGSRPLQILGLFFLVGFTFMFFGNTVWPFFVQYNIGHSELMFMIGLIGSIPGIFLVFLWPIIRKWIGKKMFFELFLAVFILGSVLLFMWDKNPSNTLLGYTGRFLQQWGLTAATGFMWALVPEVITYNEHKSGKRVAGIINALMGLFFKIGLALGGIIPGYMLAATGFDATKTAQSSSALSGLVNAMVWVPIALAIVAGIIMWMYPLTDEMVNQMNKKIAEKN